MNTTPITICLGHVQGRTTKFVRVAAYAVTTCHPDLHLYVHRSVRTKGEWTVTAAHCGMGLCHGPTRERAVAEARRLEDNLGRDAIMERIRSFPAAPRPETVEPHTPRPAAPRPDLGAIVRAIAQAIPLEPAEEAAVRAALSPVTGRLRSRRPQGMAGAAWSGMQPNPWKVSPWSFMTAAEPERQLTLKLSKYTWPACLDTDAHKLQLAGVW
jgi:hypothetical protein